MIFKIFYQNFMKFKNKQHKFIQKETFRYKENDFIFKLSNEDAIKIESGPKKVIYTG